MKIPEYIKEILKRSEYNFSIGDAGYTINIHKESAYKMVGTLNKEAERLVKWANRQVPQFEDMPTARIERIPQKTRYCDQVATVTIYDPVMQHIEDYIRKGE